MDMKQKIVLASCCLAVGIGVSSAMAQDRIYRCDNNEYTNSAAIAKQRNCQVVEGGHVTVVNTGAAKPAAKPPSAASSRPAASNRAAQVTSEQQQSRDNDARAILQSELSKAQEKLTALKAEYNNGNPVKSALELRNPQVFNERFEALKASITRQEADVAGIERELSRLSGG